jgi:hypothetical protein
LFSELRLFGPKRMLPVFRPAAGRMGARTLPVGARHGASSLHSGAPRCRGQDVMAEPRMRQRGGANRKPAPARCLATKALARAARRSVREPPTGVCAIANVENEWPSRLSNCKYYLNE